MTAVENRRDRWLVVTIAAVGFMLILLLLAVGAVLNRTDTNVGAQARSDEIAGCRSSYNAELISGPQADALKLLAIYGAESTQFQEATQRIDPERFQELARLSRTDPAEFLAECRRDQPPD